jgi:hypothetical protein
LQIANQVAIDQFLELNTILQYPKVVAELIVKNKVQPDIVLQFVNNIKKFLQEERSFKVQKDIYSISRLYFIVFVSI